MRAARFPERRSSFSERLKEIDRFFAGRSEVHRTMRSLAQRLDKASVAYAVYGGMAVNAHGHQQTTDDVDILLTPEGLRQFREELERWYQPTRFRQGRRFLDRANGVPIDVVVSGHCPGMRRPGSIQYPDPTHVSQTLKSVRYVNLVWLIQLKLATARYRDLGDVAALIAVHGLDESYMANLPPSLHPSFINCLEEYRREAQYEAREG
jgi:hypothetical protein